MTIMDTDRMDATSNTRALSNARTLSALPDFSDILDFADMLRRELTRFVERLQKDIENGVSDNVLELLLKIMKLAFWLDDDYRKNIERFHARYAFRSQDGGIAASAIFYNGKMDVKSQEIQETNATIIFKDGKALWELLLADDPNIFEFILSNDLWFEGNFNYILKFAYMARHLKRMFEL